MADKELANITGGRVAYVGGRGHVEFDLEDGKVARLSCTVDEAPTLADEVAAETKARETLEKERLAHEAEDKRQAKLEADRAAGLVVDEGREGEQVNPDTGIPQVQIDDETSNEAVDSSAPGLEAAKRAGEVPLDPRKEDSTVHAAEEGDTTQTDAERATAVADAGGADPEPTELKGKLPEDFPGYKALSEADPPITTYGQLRKARRAATDWAHIEGIGRSTSDKIAAALAAPPVAPEA